MIDRKFGLWVIFETLIVHFKNYQNGVSCIFRGLMFSVFGLIVYICRKSSITIKVINFELFFFSGAMETTTPSSGQKHKTGNALRDKQTRKTNLDKVNANNAC